MGINKKECRKYADPGLLISSGSGLLCMENLTYIIRTAVKNIAGQRTLLLYFYDKLQAVQGQYVLMYTMFQTKNDYITWDQTEDGKGKWRISSFDRMGNYPDYFNRICAFYSPTDETRVTRFCAVSDKTGFNALSRKQQAILDERTRQRTLARERKIIERMKCVPAVPRDFKGFIHREVLPAYIIYTYHKIKKPMKGYCTACRHDVTVAKARHGLSGVCPRCKRSITFKASGRIGSLYDRATVQIVQKINNKELLVRIFKTNKSYRSSFREPRVSVWENARFFVCYQGDEKMNILPHYYAYGRGILTRWKKGFRPILNKWAVNFEPDLCGYLYHRNLDDVLAETAWEYSQMKQFYLKERNPLETLPYFHSYLRYPMIEYLIKLGLSRMAAYVIYNYPDEDVLNLKGKNIREILDVSPQDIPFLQEVNANIYQLALLQKLRKCNIRFDPVFLRWCQNIGKPFQKDVLLALDFTTPMKLMRYIDRQYEKVKDEKVPFGQLRYENANRVLSEYKDYLRLAVKLEYDLKNDFVLFPHDLKKAHDLASDLYEEHESEINDRMIGGAYDSLLKRYSFTKNGFTIIPPKTAQEIVSEGHALRHCVGTYVSNVADGESVILFLRRTEEPGKPFYTMELRDGRIHQTRGQSNGSTTPEVKKYLALFERKMLHAESTLKAA